MTFLDTNVISETMRMAPDGMIAAIAHVNGGKLATRNRRDFEHCGVETVSPWEF